MDLSLPKLDVDFTTDGGVDGGYTGETVTMSRTASQEGKSWDGMDEDAQLQRDYLSGE